MLEYLFDDVPEPAEVRQIVPGVLWLRMPLPMELDHINLYLLEDHDGWWIVDTGIALGECNAHLNFLLHRGQLERSLDEEGRYRYRSVDDTLPMRLRKHRPSADESPPLQV